MLAKVLNLLSGSALVTAEGAGSARDPRRSGYWTAFLVGSLLGAVAFLQAHLALAGHAGGELTWPQRWALLWSGLTGILLTFDVGSTPWEWLYYVALAAFLSLFYGFSAAGIKYMKDRFEAVGLAVGVLLAAAAHVLLYLVIVRSVL